MKRFGEGDFFGDEDQHFEYDEDYGGEHEAIVGGAIPADLIQQWKRSEISLEENKINFVILQQAIGLLEKSWLWRFRSPVNRIKLISDTYYALLDLVLGE